MQPGFNSPQQRTSYGFASQDNFVLRASKGFPIHASKPQHFSEHLSNAIRDLDTKYQTFESPNHKKLHPGETSPVYSPTTNKNSLNESSFKPHFFPTNTQPHLQEQPNDHFLRGSCSNVLRKFESSTNLGCSLRNTTHFNAKSKFVPGMTELKKSGEGYGNTINNGANRLGPQESPSCNLLRPLERPRGEALSKTPTKLFGQGKLDQNTKVISKTPVKYKNVFQNPNKNSNISKGSTETGEKPIFKSLNEIVESKAKEKMLMETSKSPKKQSKIVNGFEIGQVLGKGKFGEVFLGRHREAGFVVALKKVVKSKVAEFKMVEQFCNEIRLHSCLDHSNIVRFYGCFEEGQDMYLVIEYMNGGTLFDYLNEVNFLALRETVEYLRDIIEALVYMHQKSIAHRDIKPENIVISSEGVAKLCDFGWAALVETSRKTYCGTFDYAPPQILERKNYDTSVDIWCIGVLTYELLTGRVPFEGDQRNQVMEKILNVDKHKFDYPIDFAPEAKQFIQALVQKDPNLRPKSQDLLKFKLFQLFPSKMSKSGSSKRSQ